MPPEKQVTSLGISKRLKELGVKQAGLFWWVLNGNSENGFSLLYECEVFNMRNEKFDRCVAFTVAELGEMLPVGFGVYKNEHGRFTICEIKNSSLDNVWAIGGNNEAEARGKILIYLLENNLIKP